MAGDARPDPADFAERFELIGGQPAAEPDERVAGHRRSPADGRRPLLQSGGVQPHAPVPFGTAPRTIDEIRNPGGRNLVLLLEKRVGLGGPRALELRLEAFNVSNSVQRGGPGTSIATASFGRIFYTRVNTLRQIQLAARVSS